MDRDKVREEIENWFMENVDCEDDHFFPRDKARYFTKNILSLLAPVLKDAEKWDRIGTHVYGLAMLVLQSPFYRDLDVKEVVDIILGETMPDILKEAP